MYVRVSVKAAAKRERFAAVKDTFEIDVKEPANRNLANTRARELLAAHFKIPIGNVRLIAGHRSPKKVFSIQ